MCTDTSQNFGITVETKFLDIKPRYMSQPTLCFEGFAKVLFEPHKGKPPKAAWDLLDISRSGSTGSKKFMRVVDRLDDLTVFYVTGGELDTSKVPDYGGPANRGKLSKDVFVGYVQNALPLYGFLPSDLSQRTHNISPLGHFGKTPVARRQDFCTELDRAYTAASSPRSLLIMLASENADDFAHIKWWADCVQGVASVCIKPKAVKKVAGSAPSGDPTTLANLW